MENRNSMSLQLMIKHQRGDTIADRIVKDDMIEKT
jgi:hypothetical protein